ncbi:MAG: hypothetical protein RDU20_19395 [Desulfomonilaceae bacterium]|nr:hypothetical protein [Desulfomonilaceae bacterium]
MNDNESANHTTHKDAFEVDSLRPGDAEGITSLFKAVYEKELRFLYSDLDDEREILISNRNLPGSTESEAEMTVFDFAGVCRIAVPAIGSDFDMCMRKIETKALDRKVVVLQAWLNLGCPHVGAAVNVLRDRGHFLGGLLPCWFGDDGLLVQKITVDRDFEGVQLYSDRAKQIFKMVRQIG